MLIRSTTVNVYFNDDNNYCDGFGCTVNGYVNDYIEGQDSLSLCQVQDGGELYYQNEPFDPYIPLSFDLPEVRSAMDRRAIRPPLVPQARPPQGVSGEAEPISPHVEGRRENMHVVVDIW